MDLVTAMTSLGTPAAVQKAGEGNAEGVSSTE